MSDWFFALPVVWMTVIILMTTCIATAAIYVIVMKRAIGEHGPAFKAISGGILSPLAIVFALLVGFLAAQVWSDADRAHAAVNHEASALRTIVLLGAAFPGETDGRLRDLVRTHIQDAMTHEWPGMSRHNVTLTLIPLPLAEALRLTVALTPQGDGQTAAQRALVEAIQAALEARRQRIILSGSSVNWVKWLVLLAQAGVTLVTIAMVHADNARACRTILAIFATSVGLAVTLIAAHSRPFTGELSVSPAILQQVMPEAVDAAGS
jgi:hypothetical protein